eukprot:12766-Heterococcus_DN1.PRE.4
MSSSADYTALVQRVRNALSALDIGSCTIETRYSSTAVAAATTSSNSATADKHAHTRAAVHACGHHHGHDHC